MESTYDCQNYHDSSPGRISPMQPMGTLEKHLDTQHASSSTSPLLEQGREHRRPDLDAGHLDAASISSCSGPSIMSLQDLAGGLDMHHSPIGIPSLSWLQIQYSHETSIERARTNVRFWVGGSDEEESSELEDQQDQFLMYEDAENASEILDIEMDGSADLIRMDSKRSLSLKDSTRSWSYTHDLLHTGDRAGNSFLHLPDSLQGTEGSNGSESSRGTPAAATSKPETSLDAAIDDSLSSTREDASTAWTFPKMLDLMMDLMRSNEAAKAPTLRSAADLDNVPHPRCPSDELNSILGVHAARGKDTKSNRVCNCRSGEATIPTGSDGPAVANVKALGCRTAHAADGEFGSTGIVSVGPSWQEEESATPELCSSASDGDESLNTKPGPRFASGASESIQSSRRGTETEKLVSELSEVIYRQWMISHIGSVSPTLKEYTAAGGEGQQTSSKGSNKNSVETEYRSNAKRRRRDEKEDGDSSDGGSSGRRGGSRRGRTSKEGGQDGNKVLKLLACPYFKLDPRRYSEKNMTEQNYRGCSSRWLPDIGRLKQHLHRVHEQPRFYCARCYETFANRADMDVHSRKANSCGLVPPKFTECMSDDMAIQIKKKHHKASIVDAWYKIWAILFPTETAPTSPSDVEDALKEELEHFLGQFRRQAPDMIRTELQQRGLLVPGTSDALINAVLAGATDLIVQSCGAHGHRGSLSNLPNHEQPGMSSIEQPDTLTNNEESPTPPPLLLAPQISQLPENCIESNQMWLPGIQFAVKEQMTSPGHDIGPIEAPMNSDFVDTSLYSLEAIYDANFTEKITAPVNYPVNANQYTWS